jgi:hypothetical protein
MVQQFATKIYAPLLLAMLQHMSRDVPLVQGPVVAAWVRTLMWPQS